jgi:hypothetical protein
MWEKGLHQRIIGTSIITKHVDIVANTLRSPRTRLVYFLSPGRNIRVPVRLVGFNSGWFKGNCINSM